MARVLIGLGANLGRPHETLDAALGALQATPGIRLGRVSERFETRPVGGPAGQPRYVNAAAELSTDLDPLVLLHRLQALENRFGRRRERRWDARTLDLDILLVDERTIASAELIVPHPWMIVRKFVLDPLQQIAGDVRLPGSELSIHTLWRHLRARPLYLAIGGSNASARNALARGLAEGRNEELILDEKLGKRTGWQERLEDRTAALDRERWKEPRDCWIMSDFVLRELGEEESETVLAGGADPLTPTLVVALDSLERSARLGLEQAPLAFRNHPGSPVHAPAGLWVPVVRPSSTDLANQVGEIRTVMDAITG